MSKEFDPDAPHVKVRGMGQVHFEQNGKKFNSGGKYIGPVASEKPAKPAKPKPDAKEDVRARARKKIGKKIKPAKPGTEDPLDGFRGKETPDAVSSAVQENAAAKAAEESV